MLIFASSNDESLEKEFVARFGNRAHVVISKTLAHVNQDHHDSVIKKLITNAKSDCLKDKHAGGAKPDVVEIFCKPYAPGDTKLNSQQQIELERLRSTYKAIKLYSHQEGNHFVGTLLPHSFKPQEEKKMEEVVLNFLRRLETQRSSVSAPIFGLMQKAAPRSTLQLGLHVSQLVIPSLATDGEQTSGSGKGEVEREIIMVDIFAGMPSAYWRNGPNATILTRLGPSSREVARLRTVLLILIQGLLLWWRSRRLSTN